MSATVWAILTNTNNPPDGSAQLGIRTCLVVVVGLVHDPPNCPAPYTDAN